MKLTKFKDIRRYVSGANYSVTSDWKYLNEALKGYQDMSGGFARLDLNPDFQRGHVWNESQQIAYIEYALRGGVSGHDIYLNCKGWNRNYEGPFVIVDGLQRITAVLRFINNEIPVFGSFYKEFTDRIPHEGHFTIHINNLETREEVLQWYIQMNDGGTPHSPKEIARVKEMLKNTK